MSDTKIIKRIDNERKVFIVTVFSTKENPKIYHFTSERDAELFYQETRSIYHIPKMHYIPKSTSIESKETSV